MIEVANTIDYRRDMYHQQMGQPLILCANGYDMSLWAGFHSHIIPDFCCFVRTFFESICDVFAAEAELLIEVVGSGIGDGVSDPGGSHVVVVHDIQASAHDAPC